MAHISTFIYCEDTQQIQVGTQKSQLKINLIGPMQIMTPMFIPSMFSFSICFGILDFDMSVPHKLRVVFKESKEKEKPIIDTEDMNFSIPIQEKKIALPENMNGSMINFNFKNIALRHEGTYCTSIYFDDSLLGDYPIDVKAVENV